MGASWFVRVVRHPLFEKVGAASYPADARTHSRLTAVVAGHPMLVETAVALARTGFGLVALVWVSTALLRAARHRVLGPGLDPGPHRFQVASNRGRAAARNAWGFVAIRRRGAGDVTGSVPRNPAAQASGAG